MGTDRININADIIKSDAAYLNEMANAKTIDDVTRAAQALRERQIGIVDLTTGEFRRPPLSNSASEKPREVTRTVEIGGREFTFRAPNESTLENQIETAKTVAQELEAGQVRDDKGRFVARSAEAVDDGGAEVARQTELQLRMLRGQIDIKTYLQESGAVASYLHDEGVPLEELRALAQHREASANEQEWKQATESFLNGPGGDWPGGAANQRILQNTLLALGLQDSEDKLGALVAAYEEMKRGGTIFAYEQTAPGVKAAVEKVVNEASPEELLAAWKEQFAVSGGDARAANAALIESFRRKG